MEKVTITKVFTKQEISPRTGKPYTRMGILTNEYGDRWLSGFQNKGNSYWKEGDTVEVIVNRVHKNDKEYLNFELPNKTKMLEDRIALIEQRLAKLENAGKDVGQVVEETWDEEVAEDSPF